MSKKECLNCDSHEVREVTTTGSITDRSNRELMIDGYRYFVCDECEFEFVTAEQARANEQLVKAARDQDYICKGVEQADGWSMNKKRDTIMFLVHK